MTRVFDICYYDKKPSNSCENYSHSERDSVTGEFYEVFECSVSVTYKGPYKSQEDATETL